MQYETTAQETTVTDYLDYPLRIYPVGRLDKESQGLLLLTNEGDLVNKIMRAGKLSRERILCYSKQACRQGIYPQNEQGSSCSGYGDKTV